MQRTHSRETIVNTALELMIKRGLKSLTMDALASELSMSKRTIYEIFESKHNLITEVLERLFYLKKQRAQQIVANNPNIMEAMVDIGDLQASSMTELAFQFFRDMDILYPDIRDLYKSAREKERKEWQLMYDKGVEEGVFREGVNINLYMQMFMVQMEALKRLDPALLGNFTLHEMFVAIFTSLLRNLATTKGLEILENKLRTQQTPHQAL